MTVEKQYNYSFILGDKTYFIRDENELALTFELLETVENRETLQWNVIMALDEQLLEIIKTYKGLFLCMKHLGFRHRFLLLVKIGDILPHVLEKSEYLGSILAGIPEENDKIRLLKSMRRKGLVHVIQNAENLGNILEWVYGEAEQLVIDTLGKEFLETLFSSGRDIYRVFHFLNDTNKDYLTDMLSMAFIRERVRTMDDFVYIIKALTAEKCEELIVLFSPEELRIIIKSDTAFHSFLKKITYRKEAFLLHYLGL